MKKGKSYGVILTMIAVFVLLMYAWWQGEQKGKQEEKQSTNETVQSIIYENAWIVNMENREMLLYKDDKLYTFSVNSDKMLKEVLADVTIENEEVKNIRLKTDVISGKVLAVNDDNVEIEGYGKVALDENVAIIKNYGELESAQVRDVLVGYAFMEFIVGEGKICGIVMDSEPSLENIRVIIMTSNYEEMYHDKIRVSSDGAFTVTGDGEIKLYKAGEEAVIDKNALEKEDRIYITAENDNSMLILNSVRRNCGTPSYHGTFEIINDENGLIIINELSLEEYLYSVLPSEMPTSYGLEALKAQAVCARSYAYKQIQNNSLSKYGAHVDDSSQYQVYNNIAETKLTIEAVNQTKGQILTYEGEVVEAFYFSTSCGHTTDTDIWGGHRVSYVKGKLLDGSNAKLLLDTEEKFAAFIKNRDFESYDREFAWYRWETEFTLDDLTEFAKMAGFSKKVGTVESIEVAERGTGGIVKKLKINGNAGSVIVEREYAVRKFLNPQGYVIKRADNTTVDNFPLLPSAYFTAEPVFEGTELMGYHIYGGGFGHGAGMSQNGAKAMTDAGISYDEVLKYFFEDISISNCYSY
ncbi:MAG: SpoIID/LytB domain-containing protein [Lachnospiraceae bacterium]|nr:SpoIID/LytB domain-containing protein [Lachnospiraceae bacterium]